MNEEKTEVAVLKTDAGEIVIEEGAADQVSEALRTMEAATRDEPGCLTYAFSLDICEPTTMRITERWESTADLAAHFATPHMAEFQAAMAANPSEGTEVHCYEANEVDFPPF